MDGLKSTLRSAGVFLAGLVLVLVIAALLAPSADARPRKSHPKRPEYTSIVIDAETGNVVSERNADLPNYPASLTKMMTLYLLFDALDKGRVHLDTEMPVSQYAASQEPTKLGLQPGESITVHDAILGLVTRSANDAAVVIAEALAGSEDAFAERMNAKARLLGMKNTTFRNASGLPDPEQMTTARDLAKLARALYLDFPKSYRFFATEKFQFHGRLITTHNHLMQHFAGMDGIKTGYIRASGFNLAASAVRDNRRLIGIVMGGRSAASRDHMMAGLLNTAFDEVGSAEPAPGDAMTKLVQANSEVEPSASAPAVASAADTSPKIVGTAAEPDAQTLAARAKRTLHNFSPVSPAEAAPVAPKTARAENAADRWSIQVGAFSQKRAAERAAARALATIPASKGKMVTVLPPSRPEHERFYRARIINFSQREAEHACYILHKKRRDCAVRPPSALHMAQVN